MKNMMGKPLTVLPINNIIKTYNLSRTAKFR
jgi:hypothetical protein